MSNIINETEELELDRIMGVSPAEDRYLAIFPDTKSEVELEAGDMTGEITEYAGDRPALVYSASTQVNGMAQSANTAEIQFETMPAATVGYVMVVGMPTGTVGAKKVWKPITDVSENPAPRTIQAGDRLVFQVGELKFRLD